MQSERDNADGTDSDRGFRFSVFQKCLLLIVVPWAASMAFIVYTSGLLEQSDQVVHKRLASTKILSTEENFVVGNMIADLTCATYFLSHRDQSSKLHAAGTHRMTSSLKELKQLLADQPDRLDLLKGEIRRTISDLKRQGQIMSLPATISTDTIMHLASKNPKTEYQNMAGGELLANLMDEDTRSEQAIATQFRALRGSFIAALLCGVFGSITISAMLGLFFYRNILGRLSNVQHNILCLSGHGTLMPPLGKGDEIADLDNQIHGSAKRIIDLQNYKKDVTAIIGRQFAEPLVEIDAGLQALRGSRNVDSRFQSLIDKASTSLSRLIRLANQLLDIDQLEDSTFDLKVESVAILTLINSSIAAVEGLAAERNIKIATDAQDATLHADIDRIIEVLVNLLSNAIKFSPDSSIVKVTGAQTAGQIRLSVIDSGRGIPPEFQKKLFERFSQVRQTDSEDHKGFGLGLSICKSIVDAHGGSITVTSTLGLGSTWVVTLPLAPSSQPLPSAEQESAKHKGFMKHLIVDAKLSRKGLIVVCLPLLLQAAALAALAPIIINSQVIAEKTSVARDITSKVIRMSREQMHLASLALSYHVLKAPWMLDEYKKEKQAFDAEFAALRSNPLIAPYQTKSTDQAIESVESFADQIVTSKDAGDDVKNIVPADKLAALEDGGKNALAKLDKLRMRADELAQEQALQSEQSRAWVTGLIASYLVLNTLLALGLAVFVYQSISQRISRLNSNAQKLVAAEPLGLPGEGQDELAQIDELLFAVGTKLLQLEQFKQNLVSMIGHDLRTPLNTVMGLFELIAKPGASQLSPEETHLAQSGGNLTERLIDLINNVLDVEKAKAARSTVDSVTS